MKYKIKIVPIERYKMKRVPYIIILIGLVALLFAALAFIGIILIVPNTTILDSDTGILLAILYFFGSLIVMNFLILGIIFLILHIRHRKNKCGDGYFWALFLISLIAIILSILYLIKFDLTESNFNLISDFAKLSVVSVACGILLPFIILICGCFINIIQRKNNKFL